MSDERSNGNNKQTNQCGHIAVPRLQSHPRLSFSLSLPPFVLFSFSRALLYTYLPTFFFFFHASVFRTRRKSRGIWAVRNARRGAFGVQGKMVSASARSGISGSDRVAQRGFLWVMHEVSPILLRPGFPPASSHRPTRSVSRSRVHRLSRGGGGSERCLPLLPQHVSPYDLTTEACIARTDIPSLSLSRESGSCPFYQTGSYGFSMRGRTTRHRPINNVSSWGLA